MSSRVYSKRNGLRVTLPTDAQNVIHRFMLGGDNSLIFKPISRENFEKFKRAEHKTMASGGKSDDPELEREVNSFYNADVTNGVSRNFVEEDEVEDEAPKKTTKRPTKKSAKIDVSEEVEL